MNEMQDRVPTLLLLFLVNIALAFGDICTVQSIDDLNEAIKSCTNIIISNVTVPPGKTLSLVDLKPGTSVLFEGTTEFEYEQWTGPLIRVSGEGLKISGAPGHVLNGNGALWWDGLGKPTDPKEIRISKVKPKFITLDGVNNSVITNLHIKNTPVHCMTFYACHNVSVLHTIIDNSDGNELITVLGKSLQRGHNTDGFNVGKEAKSSNITISHCKVINQDDCLAVNAGSDITFTNNYCATGHGISIGSVGGWLENEVDRVTVANCSVVDSENGIRVKTTRGAIGRVSNVTFADVKLSNISKYGILMNGNYYNGSPSGYPTGGVPISGLTLRNISGTVAKGGTNVWIIVNNASDWSWTRIGITGGTRKVSCIGIPKGSGASCD